MGLLEGLVLLLRLLRLRNVASLAVGRWHAQVHAAQHVLMPWPLYAVHLYDTRTAHQHQAKTELAALLSAPLSTLPVAAGSWPTS